MKLFGSLTELVAAKFRKNGFLITTRPNQATTYAYNTLGKLVHVAQGSQDRYFQYDALGRTSRIFQPEQEVNTSLNTSRKSSAASLPR